MIAAYLAWYLWGTGLYTRAAQEDLRQAFAADLVRSPGSRPLAVPPPGRSVRLEGEAWAVLEIPRIDVDVVVVEGTSVVDLKKGPGRYINTAYPWDPAGRVGIAGHRTTYGSPFWSLDELRAGDRIVMLTEYGEFEYRVRRLLEILPHQAEVLNATKKPTLVLTTCSPRYSAARRLVVVADRVSAQWAAGVDPASIPKAA